MNWTLQAPVSWSVIKKAPGQERTVSTTLLARAVRQNSRNITRPYFRHLHLVKFSVCPTKAAHVPLSTSS